MRLPPAPQYTARLIGSPPGARGNFHTLRLMRAMINDGKTDPRVMQAAHSIIVSAPQYDELSEARALFVYVRDFIRYVKDVHGVETLCAPAMTLQRMIGDCDDQVMLLCAMLEASGYPTRIVMTGYHGREYEHVYCQVFAAGQWIDCDPIIPSAPFGYSVENPTIVYVEPM